MVDRDIWWRFGNASTLTFSDQFIVDREEPCETRVPIPFAREAYWL